MANGFPISAVVGRRQYMRRMEDIFFSGTFGGDAIALAAANAVIGKMRRLDVPARLADRGQQLLSGLDALLQKVGCPELAAGAGHPSWSFLLIGDSANHSSWLLKSYFIQELCKRGILSLGSHNLNLAPQRGRMYRPCWPSMPRSCRRLYGWMRTKPFIRP